MISYHTYQAACVLRASGPDASEFLQGQFSNDLSKMEVGDSVYGLWLNRKGKIVADSFVLRRGDDDYLIVSYHCSEQAIFERLDAYLIMEEVELAGLTGFGMGRSFFRDFGSVPSEAAAYIPKDGRFIESAGVVTFWGRRASKPCLEVLAFSENSRSSFDRLCAGFGLQDGHKLEPSDLARLAIEAKVPRIGMGFGESDLPQELGLEKSAVSFNKGCYLGQEVMARLHAMGKVRKELSLFSIEESGTIDLPADLLDSDGKRQGSLREVVYSESGGVGLGVLSQAFSGEVLRAGDVSVRPVNRGRAGED